MICPMCRGRLVMTGHAVLESSSVQTHDDAASSLRNTYQCFNPVCESYQEDITWSHNGVSFIMHYMGAYQEASLQR